MDFFHTFILSEKTRFGYPFVVPYLVFFVWRVLQRAQVASRPAYSPLAKTRPGAADPSPRLHGAGLSLECRHGAAAAGLPCSDTCPGTRAMQSACPLRHPIGCWPRAKPNGVSDTDPVGRDARGRTPSGTRGVRGIPRPFEGGIGGPGGHRGEVGIPPAPLAGGATPRRKSISQVPHSPLFTFLPAAHLCCLFLCADSRG